MSTTTRQDFAPRDLPWVDRDDFPAEAARQVESGRLTEEDRALLERWREDGYLYLPGLLSDSHVESFLESVEAAWRERPPLKALVEGKGLQDFPDVAPRKELPHHFRVMDLQDVSEPARDLILHREIVRLVRLILGDRPVGMQSLYFEYGSEQAIHQDFPYVQSEKLPHLIGCWMAGEDVDDDNGPLFYLPGSHRFEKFDWGSGSLVWDGQDEAQIPDFEAFLHGQQKEHGLERKVFHARKGDVFLWHAALVHGGSPAKDPERTRQSFVVHYSSEEAYPRDRRDPLATPRRLERNGALIYLPGSRPRWRGLARRVLNKLRG